MSKFLNYIQEAYDELIHKVTWPNATQLQKDSIIVIVSLVISSFVVLGMDILSKEVMKLVYGFAAR